MSEENTLQHILKRLDRLDEAIRGNGKKGLRQEVDELSISLTNCRSFHEAASRLRFEQRERWWNRLVQPAVVLVYGGIVVLVTAGMATWIQQTVQVDVRDQVRMVMQQEYDGSGNHQ